MSHRLRRPVALVGLPGAGKSTVGEALARALGCDFVDFDVRLAASSGRSVAELFAMEGESAFRRRELALTETLLGEPPGIWAPGGGWLTAAGVRERIDGHVGMIHLQVSPGTALARVRTGATIRPLLSGTDAADVIERLVRERSAAWAAADLVLDTETLDLQQVVDRARGWVLAAVATSDGT
jgi:shikimate kinase